MARATAALCLRGAATKGLRMPELEKPDSPLTTPPRP